MHRQQRPFSRIVVLLASLSLLVSGCGPTVYFVPPSAAEAAAETAISDPGINFLFENPAATLDLTPVPQQDPPEADLLPAAGASPIAPALVQPAPAQVEADAAGSPVLYYTQAADTLEVVAVRYDVLPEEIVSPDPLPLDEVLPPNQLLIIPQELTNTTSHQRLLPDSELVYSPAAIDFDIEAYIQAAGGYLSTYTEWLQSTGTTTGAQVVQRVAIENSINPRLLLALLEFQSGWVHGQPGNLAQSEFPLGYIDMGAKGLYKQLVWAVNHLSVGYYNWREGRILELAFEDGTRTRLAPDMNAGSVALQYYFSQIYPSQDWLAALDLEQGFPALYQRMFGNPWAWAANVEPLYPPGLRQPELILPFDINRLWSYTGGPHGAWEHEGSYAAIDFAPASAVSGCEQSYAWVVASAAGLVVRSGKGVVVLDLDGDGHEQTGWVLLYLHVSSDGRIPVGTWVEAGTRLGHPSCEGGKATGTHVHFARKYNGEWIAADGPMPFVLDGWQVHAGSAAYKGTLTRGDETVTACTCGSFETHIVRTAEEP